MTTSRVTWLSSRDLPDAFPPVENALREPDGLLAAGGDLSSKRLLAAYRNGIFPWYEDGQPLLWWSPDPRCVFRRGDLHVSRRLRREIRRSPLAIRVNTSFGEVIRACAGPRRYQLGTWITQDMIAAYERLHAEGWAHSIEIFDGDELAGGLYGLAIGRAFFGESMFSAKSNTSKFALVYLDDLMASETLGIVDCQVQSSHLLALGAAMIPREDFVARLDNLCHPPERVDFWPADPIYVRELAE
ncbi:MAG: leucyl/phenylalanyl-tRNA--protein transferase [Gammaproteobacteria bacterium]|nr:leucyl/phenylalanyl-tRNA--protein transferase [Gammaproteobacteria bacterium]MBT8094968.1 leucyl/phenylalanyl-tRNA--protein transferase [Gammaproteobacteria bacterium]